MNIPDSPFYVKFDETDRPRYRRIWEASNYPMWRELRRTFSLSRTSRGNKSKSHEWQRNETRRASIYYANKEPCQHVYAKDVNGDRLSRWSRPDLFNLMELAHLAWPSAIIVWDWSRLVTTRELLAELDKLAEQYEVDFVTLQPLEANRAALHLDSIIKGLEYARRRAPVLGIEYRDLTGYARDLASPQMNTHKQGVDGSDEK